VQRIREGLSQGILRGLRTSFLAIGRHLSDRGISHLKGVVGYLEIGHWADGDLATVTRCSDKTSLFSVALDHVRGERPVYLEFGVYEGSSLRWWAENLENPRALFVGFDSFLGLPEDWRPGYDRGTFAVSDLPAVKDDRVELVAGWFQDTLRDFTVPSHDQLIVNIDCDLYSSARTVLEAIGPQLVPGDLVYFDELGDRDHEFRALEEWLKSGALGVTPLAIADGGLKWLFECRADSLGASLVEDRPLS
jgi:hypothetical protein